MAKCEDLRLSNKAQIFKDYFDHNNVGSYESFLHSTKNERGVGICVKRGTFDEILNIYYDNKENYILMSVLFKGSPLLIGSIYGPLDRDDRTFYSDLAAKVLSFNIENFLLLGDFNAISNLEEPEKNINLFKTKFIPNPKHSADIVCVSGINLYFKNSLKAAGNSDRDNLLFSLPI